MTRNGAQQLAAAIEHAGAWNVYVSGSDAHAVLTVIDPLTLDARRIVETAAAGELLAQLERGTPGPKTELDNTLLPNSSEYAAVLTENDINLMTAHRWQTVATVPDDWSQLELAL